MKKLIGTAMLAALLATSAFAELNIGGGVTQLWSPVFYNGGDVLTSTQNPWGEGRSANVGFNWASEDGKAGATFALIYNPWSGITAPYGDAGAGSNIAPDGSRLIWVKPWDFIKLSLGHWDGINDITLVNTASWDWIKPVDGTWFAGDSRLYSENQATGAMIELFPVENLVIRAGLPFKNPDKSYHMFEGIAADVEYTIEDVLGIKVGWRGGRNSHRDANFAFGPDTFKDGSDFMNVGEVDVLLSLLAVENLQLDLGTRINILNSDYAKSTNAAYNALKAEDKDKITQYGKAEFIGRSSALIGLKAGYNITDNFSIKADFGVLTYKDAKFDDNTGKHKPDFEFGVGVGVGLTDSLSLVADFRGLIKGDAELDGKTIDGGDPTFSFLVGVNYACSSNASVGIGFQGKTNGGDVINPDYSNAYKKGDNFGFAIPIRVSVSF